jgi:hypothetical protein
MSRLSALPLLLLAACAPAAQPAADGAPPMEAQPTVSAGPGIMGDYTLTLTEADVPASASAEMRSGMPGRWGLAFHGGNHFVVTHNGSEVVQGSYRVEGDRIMFSTGETGPYACNVEATYTWRVSNGQLTFTPVGSDACEGRVLALTTRPYARTP